MFETNNWQSKESIKIIFIQKLVFGLLLVVLCVQLIKVILGEIIKRKRNKEICGTRNKKSFSDERAFLRSRDKYYYGYNIEFYSGRRSTWMKIIMYTKNQHKRTQRCYFSFPPLSPCLLATNRKKIDITKKHTH